MGHVCEGACGCLCMKTAHLFCLTLQAFRLRAVVLAQGPRRESQLVLDHFLPDMGLYPLFSWFQHKLLYFKRLKSSCWLDIHFLCWMNRLWLRNDLDVSLLQICRWCNLLNRLIYRLVLNFRVISRRNCRVFLYLKLRSVLLWLCDLYWFSKIVLSFFLFNTFLFVRCFCPFATHFDTARDFGSCCRFILDKLPTCDLVL